MKITKTTIDQLVNDDSGIKAYATIVIDDSLTITNIIIKEYEGQDHLVMPGCQDRKGEYSEFLRFEDKGIYEYFRTTVLTAYRNQKILDDIYDSPEGYKGG